MKNRYLVSKVMLGGFLWQKLDRKQFSLFLFKSLDAGNSGQLMFTKFPFQVSNHCSPRNAAAFILSFQFLLETGKWGSFFGRGGFCFLVAGGHSWPQNDFTLPLAGATDWKFTAVNSQMKKWKISSWLPKFLLTGTGRTKWKRRRFPETISGLVSLDETKTLVNGSRGKSISFATQDLADTQ